MPDTWEYPWYAAWDLAFHCVALAHVDPGVREVAARPAVPRVVHAPERPAARLRVVVRRRQPAGARVGGAARLRDRRRRRLRLPRARLPQAAPQLHLVGEPQGRRRATTSSRAASSASTTSARSTARRCRSSGRLEQSDGTAWMAMYCQNLLELALLLAEHDPTYEDLATKFFEHFALIAIGAERQGPLERGGRLLLRRAAHGDGAASCRCARARSSACCRSRAVTTLGPETMARLPDFMARVEWFTDQPARGARGRPAHGVGRARGLADALDRRRGRACAGSSRAMLDPAEFLSDHGLRALSKFHEANPLHVDARRRRRRRSTTSRASRRRGLFGGNSNWRGPIWFPINYLLVEALRVYHRYLGDDFTVEFPTGSGRELTPRAGRRRARGAADRRSSSSGDGRPPPGLRRLRAVPARPGLARPDPVPRVLPRRHRRRASARRTRPAGRGSSPT